MRSWLASRFRQQETRVPPISLIRSSPRGVPVEVRAPRLRAGAALAAAQPWDRAGDSIACHAVSWGCRIKPDDSWRTAFQKSPAFAGEITEWIKQNPSTLEPRPNW